MMPSRKRVDVEEALRKVLDLSTENAPERHGDRTQSCPSLPRMREIALNPESRTRVEEAHFAGGCPYCMKAMGMMQREAWHPNPADLFLFRLGKYHGEDQDLIREHLQRDLCRRCLRIEEAAKKVESVGALFQKAKEGAVEEARGRLRGLAWGLFEFFSTPSGLLPSAGAARTKGRPNAARQPRPIGARQSEDGSLCYSLEENPPGFLGLRIWTDSSKLGGSLVRFDIYDAAIQTQAASGYAILSRRERSRHWEALAPLQSISEMPRISGGWHVFVLVVHPHELTVDNEKLLMQSMAHVSKETPAETDAWVDWIDNAMEDAAVSAGLKTLLGGLRNALR